jgi:primase-polymerase (primpol)-like protein
MHPIYRVFLVVAIAAVLVARDLDNLPDILKQGQRFVLWRSRQLPGEPKPKKFPYQTDGRPASHSDPATWSDLPAVRQEYQRRPHCYSGIMRAFAAQDGICGIDADNAYPEIQGDTAEVTPWGVELQERLGSRTYHEESVSKFGFHIYCFARPPRSSQWPLYQGNQKIGQVEIYDRTRFFVLTGNAGSTVPRTLADCHDDVALLVAALDRREAARQTQTRQRPYIPPSPARHFSSPAAISMALAILDRYGVRGPLEHPYRHPTLLRLMGALHRRGLVGELLEWVLGEVNQRFCQPPYAAAHIATMVRSTARWQE